MGALGLDKINRVRLMNRNHKPMIMYLIETGVDCDHVFRFCSTFSRGWNWAAIVANGYSGGIITLWRDGLGHVTPIVKSNYILHLVISNPSLDSLIISIIYNSYKVHIQKRVWGELTRLASHDAP